MRRFAAAIVLVLALLALQPGPIIASTDDVAIGVLEVLDAPLSATSMAFEQVLLNEMNYQNDTQAPADRFAAVVAAISITGNLSVWEPDHMRSRGSAVQVTFVDRSPDRGFRMGYDVLKMPN